MAAGRHAAAQTTVHPEASEAISGLRSPYCPGLMLEVCTSAGAAALRDSIQAMAESGLEADTIIERVLARYGEEWRAEPRRSGAGLWAWLLPPLFLTAGIAVVIARARVRRRPADPAFVARAPDERDAERLRQALLSLEESERPDW